MVVGEVVGVYVGGGAGHGGAEHDAAMGLVSANAGDVWGVCGLPADGEVAVEVPVAGAGEGDVVGVVEVAFGVAAVEGAFGLVGAPSGLRRGRR